MPNQPASELRAPLGAVMGYVSALDDGTLGPLAPGQQGAVKKVLDGVVRTHLLLGDVLTAADLAAGRVAFDPQPLDYGDVVAQTLDAAQPLADARELTLARRDETAGPASIDVVQVPHVLTSLLYNATKLAPRGGTVTVRLHERGDRLVTEVHDGGADLAADDLARLFGHLGQLALGGTKELVGLRVAQALVEAMGGEIGVAGAGPDRAFFFALPIG